MELLYIEKKGSINNIQLVSWYLILHRYISTYVRGCIQWYVWIILYHIMYFILYTCYIYYTGIYRCISYTRLYSASLWCSLNQDLDELQKLCQIRKHVNLEIKLIVYVNSQNAVTEPIKRYQLTSYAHHEWFLENSIGQIIMNCRWVLTVLLVGLWSINTSNMRGNNGKTTITTTKQRQNNDCCGQLNLCNEIIETHPRPQ